MPVDRARLRDRMRQVLEAGPTPAARARGALSLSPPAPMLSPELWGATVAFLEFGTRVLARAVCRAVAGAGGIGPGPGGIVGLPIERLELGDKCAGLPLLTPMLASSLGQAFISHARVLRLVCGQREELAEQLRISFPRLPMLEELELGHAGLIEFSAADCPKLRSLHVSWEALCQLQKFSLAAGPHLVAFPRPEHVGLTHFELDAPALADVLDLSSLDIGLTVLRLRCPTHALRVMWPNRSVLRRVEQLDVHLAHGGPGVVADAPGAGAEKLRLRHFTSLQSLVVCTCAAVVELPEAADLRELSIEAPAMSSLDLSEWTAFGELRGLELRDCRELTTLRLPLSGELHRMRLQGMGGELRELNVHLRVLEDLVLEAPRLSALRLAGCKGMATSEQLSYVLSRCPQLQKLVLSHCADLAALELSSGTASELRSLDLSGLSRTNKLQSVKLSAPRLTSLALCPSPLTQLAGLRVLVLSCPCLTTLNLETLQWPCIAELRVDAGQLASLYPPKCDLPTMSFPDCGSQAVEIRSECLSYLDLRQADRVASLTLYLSACHVTVSWPLCRRGVFPVSLQLSLPHIERPLPPPSHLDDLVTSVQLVSCHGLAPYDLLSSVARWPKLLSLNINDCTRLADEELISIARAAPQLTTLRCENCPLVTLPDPLSAARCSVSSLSHSFSDLASGAEGPGEVLAPRWMQAVVYLHVSVATFHNYGFQRLRELASVPSMRTVLLCAGLLFAAIRLKA